MQWRRTAEPDVVDSGDEAERSGEDSELEGDGGVRCCRNNRHQTVGALLRGIFARIHGRRGTSCDDVDELPASSKSTETGVQHLQLRLKIWADLAELGIDEVGRRRRRCRIKGPERVAHAHVAYMP